MPTLELGVWEREGRVLVEERVMCGRLRPEGMCRLLSEWEEKWWTSSR